MLSPHRVINKTLIDGGVAIRDAITNPTARKGYERQMPTIPGFDRAHTRGAGLGTEYSQGIFYAPKEVNQALQNHGIERFLKEIFQNKKSGVDLYLTTETRAHGNSQRLKEITYRLDAVFNKREYGMFEVTIEVEDKETNPRISITSPTIFRDYDEILAPKEK